MSKYSLVFLFAFFLASNGMRQVAVTLDGSEDSKLQQAGEEEAGKCKRWCGRFQFSFPDPLPGETQDQANRRVLDLRCDDPLCSKCKGGGMPCCVGECLNEKTNDKEKDTPAQTNMPGNNGDNTPGDTTNTGNNGVEEQENHVECGDYDNLERKDSGECVDLKAGPVDSSCCDELDEEQDIEEGVVDQKTGHIDERTSEGDVLDQDEDVEGPLLTPAQKACSGFGKLEAAFEKAKSGSRQFLRSQINEKALAANPAAQDAEALQDLFDEFAENSKAPKGKFGKANCDLSQSKFGKRTKANGDSTGYYIEGKGYKKASQLIIELGSCCMGPGKMPASGSGSGSGSGDESWEALDNSGSGSGSGSGSPDSGSGRLNSGSGSGSGSSSGSPDNGSGRLNSGSGSGSGSSSGSPDSGSGRLDSGSGSGSGSSSGSLNSGSGSLNSGSGSGSDDPEWTYVPGGGTYPCQVFAADYPYASANAFGHKTCSTSVGVDGRLASVACPVACAQAPTDISGSGSGSGSSEEDHVIADEREGEIVDEDVPDVDDHVEALTPTQNACSGIGELEAAFQKAKSGTGQYQRSIINEKALAANKAAQDAKALQDLLDEFAEKSKDPEGGKFGKANCDLSRSKFGKKVKHNGDSTGYYDEGKGYKKAAKLVDDLITCCRDLAGK